MIHLSHFFILITLVTLIQADIYLHNPRGSNNRLDEQRRERDNAKRLFDSQNNNRGGYNLGYMKYLAGSNLQIEWTNQHSCNSPNANCEIIIQYMCDDKLRDGSDTRTIPESNSQCENNDCNTDFRFGMNEDNEYYEMCKRRERNKGLYVADQKLRDNSARYTRQNPNGDRYAYECPEERDYYPYWHPTKWIDIAILTNDPKRCSYFQQESENVKSRFYCKVPATYKGLIPIVKSSCEKINGSIWTESSSHNVPAPVCRETQFTRDNHLGNSFGGNAPTFDWKLPSTTHESCVLRIRYNISTGDYDRFQTYQIEPNQQTNVNLNKKYGLTPEEANTREYVFKNNPKVKLFSDLDFNLNLAINTQQYGRVFQDRSHVFSIRSRESINNEKKILNLNVRGKRGNIVQVYPAVEYDFVPNKLEISKEDYVHIQWTGSNRNPPNNAGQGQAGTDRSNIVLLTQKTFGKRSESFYAPLTLNGDYGVNYPLNLTQVNFLGLSRQDLIKIALLEQNNNGGSFGELDDAGTYYDLGPRQVTSPGVYHYMSTRNNNFSNRDQKGEIIVYDNPFVDEFIGWNGGWVDFGSGRVYIPEGAIDTLSRFRIEVKSYKDVNGSDLDSLVLRPNKFDETNMASDLITMVKINSDIKKPLSMKLKLKRSLGSFESHNLYRINNQLLTKIESNIKEDTLEFDTQHSGTYVVKYDKSYGVLIGVLVSLGVVFILIGASGLFLYKNPHHLKSIRYRATNLKRSMNDQL